jgi:hypothetical protein
MNGKKARKRRKEIYGEDFSPRYRKYTMDENDQIYAGPLRLAYQQLKKGSYKVEKSEAIK